MRLTRLHGALATLLLGTATACVELNVTNPNAQTTDTFWRTSADANAGITAAYNGLLHNGTYGRWLVFATDLRSDIGMVESPWTDLSNFAKFTFVDKDFEVNREIWQHHYQAIFRANQVVARVPGIDMDEEDRARIVGEGQFLRALLYYNLVSLYQNVPLVIGEPAPEDRPATAPPGETWAQIEADLTAARAVLPQAYSGADVGRATRGAATALLAKAHMQQRDWAAAEPLLRELTATGTPYNLMANYADNFTDQFENNVESIFEVQFGGRSLLSAGVRGLNIAKMAGPCGPSFCDGRPTRWYFEQFLTSLTTAGGEDPRLDATIFYNKPGADVYGEPFVNLGRRRPPEAIFFKKWGEYYIRNGDQDWDAAINFRVIRFADILLLHAEALNELNRTTEAYPLLNRVRARAGLPALAAGLSQAGFRDAVLRERMFELGFEAQRWNDLQRHNMITRPALLPHDPEFEFFTPGKSELLPIPQSEVDLNPNVEQNPGWG